MMTDDEIGFLLMSTSFDLTTNFPLHAFKRYSTLPLKIYMRGNREKFCNKYANRVQSCCLDFELLG